MNFILLLLFVALLFEIIILRKRVSELEKYKDALFKSGEHPGEKEPPPQSAAVSHQTVIAPPVEKGGAEEPVLPVVTEKKWQPEKRVSDVRQVEQSSPSEKSEEDHPYFTAPSEFTRNTLLNTILESLKKFFTTGNVVLKVGVIILFFGVAFLLKYAAQRNLIPIEFRLAGVGIGGIVMVVSGWFFSSTGKRQYGLVLQGGGIGILYLTLFGSSRLYDLLPVSFSLLVMVSLVVLSCLLAVLQDARALASFGAIGGFLAPVLMSTGSGSHVVLFSYYGLLNCGIIGVAWYRSWRELNLIGFVFTFVISGIWGYTYYQPYYFNTVEPFLLFHFLLYVAVSVLFAYRQPVNLRGFIDGPLVFGLPIVFFAMQRSLVENVEYGTAFTALASGLMYLILAWWMGRKAEKGMKLLTEAFLALGVVFGSLAIPFALNNHMTASAWALEGAAMVWVGLRQTRLLARSFGILLQVSAAAAFFFSSSLMQSNDLFIINSTTMGALFIAFGGLFSSLCYSRAKEKTASWERYHSYILLAWGLLWFFGGVIHDIEYHFHYPYAEHYILLFFSLSALLAAICGKKLEWQEMQYPLMGFLPAVLYFAMLQLDILEGTFFRANVSGMVWLITLTTLYLHLWIMERFWSEKLLGVYHVLSVLLCVAILTHDVAQGVEKSVSSALVWPFVCYGFLPAGFVLVLLFTAGRLSWPVKRFIFYYQDYAVSFLIIWCALWLLGSTAVKGEPEPLPHIPLFNPLALSQIFCFMTFLLWHRKNKSEPGKIYRMITERGFFISVGLLGFVWINGVTARMVYLFFGVPFKFDSLLNSIVFQSAVSILWGVLALSLTIWATRKGSRQLWFAGAVLLSAVVVKLFLIDLSGTGTIARIVSFLAVGMLMLVIGYSSPLPPKNEESIE